MQIRFDTTNLEGYADALAKLNSAALVKVRTMSVNVVSLSVREKAISSTHEELNLSRPYIEQRIVRSEAQASNPTARITSEIRGATLQRFGAQQAVETVNWTNSRIKGLGVEFGPWPGWTERTGDDSRGIAKDKKAHGITVDVNRKGAKRITSAFTMPLKNGNGQGVFRRENGVVKHLYGPSVYQTFRRHITTHEAEIVEELRDDFVVRLDALIEEVLP